MKPCLTLRACLTLLFVALWSGSGCNDGQKMTLQKAEQAATAETADSPHPPEATTEMPAMYIWSTGGNRMGEPSGLLIALWPDGFILFALNPDQPGRNLRTARIEPDAVQRLLTEIEQAGFFDRPSGAYLVPDAPILEIAVRSDDQRNIHRWDERLHPHYGANIAPTPEYKSYVCMWYLTRIAVNTAYPHSHESLEKHLDQNGTLRGYHPQAPWKTHWHDADLWQPH